MLSRRSEYKRQGQGQGQERQLTRRFELNVRTESFGFDFHVCLNTSRAQYTDPRPLHTYQNIRSALPSRSPSFTKISSSERTAEGKVDPTSGKENQETPGKLQRQSSFRTKKGKRDKDQQDGPGFFHRIASVQVRTHPKCLHTQIRGLPHSVPTPSLCPLLLTGEGSSRRHFSPGPALRARNLSGRCFIRLRAGLHRQRERDTRSFGLVASQTHTFDSCQCLHCKQRLERSLEPEMRRSSAFFLQL